MPQPVAGATFNARLDGRPTPFTGGALFARCLNTVHVFLTTDSAPKSSFIIHPMGSSAMGRHPLRPGHGIDPDGELTQDPAVPGPFTLEVVIAPDSQFEADSGTVELEFSTEGNLRGRLEAWLRPSGAGANPQGTALRHLTATFFARREPGIEAGLTRGTECAR